MLILLVRLIAQSGYFKCSLCKFGRDRDVDSARSCNLKIDFLVYRVEYNNYLLLSQII